MHNRVRIANHPGCCGCKRTVVVDPAVSDNAIVRKNLCLLTAAGKL